jgi:hypothetical protein
MLNSPRRLLLLACSQRKLPSPDLLPALERYDGPPFRVLRKFLRESISEAPWLDIYVLSAKYGLINISESIPMYDCKMEPPRARELQPEVLSKLDYLLTNRKYTHFHVNLGKIYLNAVSEYEKILPSDLVVSFSQGTQGRRLSTLHNWLYSRSHDQPKEHPPCIPVGKARLRGIEIRLSSDQVLDVARQALTEGRGDPDSYQSWYVEVDERRIAPKWLVSMLTGLPVNSFVTDEARRTLSRLGIATHPCD